MVNLAFSSDSLNEFDSNISHSCLTGHRLPVLCLAVTVAARCFKTCSRYV